MYEYLTTNVGHLVDNGENVFRSIESTCTSTKTRALRTLISVHAAVCMPSFNGNTNAHEVARCRSIMCQRHHALTCIYSQQLSLPHPNQYNTNLDTNILRFYNTKTLIGVFTIKTLGHSVPIWALGSSAPAHVPETATLLHSDEANVQNQSKSAIILVPKPSNSPRDPLVRHHEHYPTGNVYLR